MGILRSKECLGQVPNSVGDTGANVDRIPGDLGTTLPLLATVAVAGSTVVAVARRLDQGPEVVAPSNERGEITRIAGHTP